MIKIIYATQTGNSKMVANELKEILYFNQYLTIIHSIDNYNYLDLPEEENLIVFIVSTTGYGEIPSSMRNFWNFLLRKDLKSESLENLTYCVFGLGDSSYELFNSTAKKLDKRFQQLGANRFLSVGLGDDQHDFGWEGEFELWSENLIIKLNKLYGRKKEIIKDGIFPYTPNYEIEQPELIKENESDFITDNSKYYEISKFELISSINESNDINSPFPLELTEKKTLFKLELKNNEKFTPGDVLNIFPENSFKKIKEFLKFTEPIGSKNELNTVIRIMDLCTKKYLLFNDENKNQSTYTTYLNLFKSIDIHGIPSKKLCLKLANYTCDDELKEKLNLFASRSFDGRNEFYRYCIKAKKSILDVFHDFKITNFPIVDALNYIGFTRPRDFSIADANEKELMLYFNLHVFSNIFSRKKLGICSNFLFEKYIEYNNTKIEFLRCKFTNSLFPILEVNKNYLMIATGTGITPLLFYLKQREKIIHNNTNIENIGDVLLFYGCRYHDLDCIEKEFLISGNFKTFFSFSREVKELNGGKIYVQQLLKLHKEKVKKLLNVDTQIFLVGNSKYLPKLVLASLREIHSEEECKFCEKNVCIFEKNINNIYIESW